MSKGMFSDVAAQMISVRVYSHVTKWEHCMDKSAKFQEDISFYTKRSHFEKRKTLEKGCFCGQREFQLFARDGR